MIVARKYMKKVIAFAVAALVAAICSSGAGAQDARSIYNKYSDEENVSAVFISPSMFRMIGRIPDLDINGSDVNLAGIIKSLKGMYILDCENARVSSSLKRDTEKMIDKDRMEMLMEVKDSGETVRIFTGGDEKVINSLVMLTINADTCTLIALDGNMLRADFEKVIAESME